MCVCVCAYECTCFQVNTSAAAAICVGVSLSVDMFSSLQHFLCFSCKGPCGGWGISQARGFPDLPARVKRVERRA